MREHDLPTWPEIVTNALTHLDAVRGSASGVRDELASDWRPVGSMLSDDAADARIRVREIVGEIKQLVDEAKDHLHRARP